MNLTERLEDIDNTIARGNFVEAGNEFFDKSIETHIQNLVTLKGKGVKANLERLQSILGDDGTVELLGQRAITADNTTVSLVAMEGQGDAESRFKLLLLIARRWTDEGRIVAEEYLPVRSTADAQAYFPETRLGPKQVQPKLTFVTPSRKRRKGGGRPSKPVVDTDLYRLPQVGKSVLAAFQAAAIKTFEDLSKAGDKVLEQVKQASGRKFVNFDPSYWREAAEFAVRGDWENMPAPQKSAPKKGKKAARVDLAGLSDRDLGRLPKVGPSMLTALREHGIHTFSDLAQVSDETLESLRQQGGRPFVNFDMNYFREAAQRKLDGAKSFPAPPKPNPKPTGGNRVGRKPREVSPTDLHLLPGVGKQLITALHQRGIVTFTDLAAASTETLQEARAETRGKYKNIDLGYLKKSAKYAADGKFDKIDPAVKIDKPKANPSTKVDRREKHLARLRAADRTDLQALPGIGTSVKTALNDKGIRTFAQLAKAKPATLREVADAAGKRFARFPIEFWIEVATLAQAGEFDKIPVSPPIAEKPQKRSRKAGGVRQARPPREPISDTDLGALPSIGKTIITALNEAGISTFAQLASADDPMLEAVRDASGPKYKTFPIDYWRTVAGLAKDGTYGYPPVPKKAPRESKGSGRRGRAPRPIEPTELRALASVGPKLAKTLRDNDLNNWTDIVEAESWRISKAMSEAGKRFANLNPDDLKRSAKDALQGKFPEPTKRGRNALPEGYDKFSDLPGIGKTLMSKLHQHKILTYKDLADAQIGTLEAIRDEVGKRVAKAHVTDWKDHARLAVAGQWSKIDPARYDDETPAETQPRAGRATKPKDGDDLTKISGIGPKAQQFFRGRGIKTYQQVLDASDDMLESLLDESGPRKKNVDAAKVRKDAKKYMKKLEVEA